MLSHYIKIGAVGGLLLFSVGYPLRAGAFSHVEVNLVKQVTIQVLDQFGKPLSGAKIYTQDNRLLGETDAREAR